MLEAISSETFLTSPQNYEALQGLKMYAGRHHTSKIEIFVNSPLKTEKYKLISNLLIDPGVGDDEKPGLPEGSLDLIGECSGGEPTGDGGGAGVTGKLQARPLGEGPEIIVISKT